MRSRIRRFLSVSHRDAFRPGLANFRVAIFLYGIVGVMLSLWLYVWCVISCPREVEHVVSLPSGRDVSIVFLHHGKDSSWIEYFTNTGGEPDVVRAKVTELLEALRSSADFPSDSRRLEIHAMRVNVRIWGWYGPFPDVRCCAKTVVVMDPDGEEERLFETFAYGGGPGTRALSRFAEQPARSVMKRPITWNSRLRQKLLPKSFSGADRAKLEMR